MKSLYSATPKVYFLISLYEIIGTTIAFIIMQLFLPAARLHCWGAAAEEGKARVTPDHPI